MIRCAFLLVACLGVFTLAGCGSKKYPVNGKVTLDGKPLASATVVFTSESGGITASGFTDDEGHFELKYMNEPLVPGGTYKVAVTKTKVVEGVSPALMDEADKSATKSYEATMKKGMAPPQKKGAIDAPAFKGATPTKPLETSLPQVYATAATTPLSVQIPAPDNNVTLDLKSKP